MMPQIQIPFQSRAGKKLLKICMGDLYPNPMVVYREYIQNSCDALQEASQLGFFKSKTEKVVSVSIYSDFITIHDRGIGVKKDDVINCLIDLSFSPKNGKSIGRYGVGRLTGAKYCDELIFETSAIGEDVKSIVRFDAKMAREIIESPEELECTEVVDRVTTYTREPESKEQHYFRVTMNHVFERHLLDVDLARDYLSETVPIDFTPEFKDYILSPSMEGNEDFKKSIDSLISCNVILDGVPVRKPYKASVINSTNVEERVGKARFFKISNDDEILAWGWYAMSVSAKMFISNVPFRKIRLRQLNMAVGDETYLDNLYYKDADPSYFIGEIFVVHDKIEPTTGRDGLVDNPYKKLFERLLKERFKEMRDEYYKLSKFGSEILDPLTKLTRSLRIINRELEAGLKTVEDVRDSKNEAQTKLKDVKDKLTNDLSKIRTNKKIDDLIDGIVDYYQNVSDIETEKHNKEKDTQKFNTQINKFDIATEIGKLMGDNSQNENDSIKFNEDESSSDEQQTDSSKEQQIESNEVGQGSGDREQVSASEMDPYKGLTKLEQSLIRKVYKILDQQKDLAPSIREKIKMRMTKKLTKK